jgi:transmembrane sensor
MSAIEERVRNLVTQQAADWFIANRTGLSAAERDAFTSWLKASPLHVEEYLALSVIARDLRKASEAARGSLDELLARARLEEAAARAEPFWPRAATALEAVAAGRRWRRVVLPLAAGGVVVLAVMLLWGRMLVSRPAASAPVTVLHFATSHGELRTQRLADDSVLHLNTDTAVTVRFSSSARVVELTTGEAEFEIARDSERPLRVLAGAAEIVDLGTRFDVRLEHDSTRVTVVEGLVKVGLLASAALPSVELGANQQLTVSAGEWPATPLAVDAQRSTAWLHRQISFDHEPLESVAREFNRYSSKPIEITTPALRKLEISGVFSTDDTDAFIAFLRSLKGVQVEVTATRIRVSQN